MTRPIKVICVAEYFLPGFKGGGPIRTISNMRKVLPEYIEIEIFTKDRDLGSNERYASIVTNCWNNTQDGPVYYASPDEFSVLGLKRAMTGRDYDVMYLNSFFSYRASIQIYRNFRTMIKKIPILLAPRGEFSEGALSLKPIRKGAYLTLCRMLKSYTNVFWHASSKEEHNDIIRQFPSAKGKIFIAEDPVFVEALSADFGKYVPSPVGEIRIAFISRISPMKNLDGLLRILATTTCRIFCDIYGPIEDAVHWSECQNLISALPSNVEVSYEGELHPESVSTTFSTYDLFAFPTLGENFGHVIFEALCAGTAVMISDQTPWKADSLGAVSVLPLSEAETWKEHLCSAANRTSKEKFLIAQAARLYAEDASRKLDSLERNSSMFTELSRQNDGLHGNCEV